VRAAISYKELWIVLYYLYKKIVMKPEGGRRLVRVGLREMG
jgi:hypothetical protein